MDPLHVIPVGELHKLKDFLRKQTPERPMVQNWIATRLRWEKNDPGKQPFFVCCPGGNFNDGLVLFGKTGHKTLYLTIHIFHDDSASLEEALLTTKRIDWSDKMMCGVPQGSEVWFKLILKSLGYEVYHESLKHYYKLSKDNAACFEIKCPDGVYINSITQDMIPEINSHWQHKFEGSLQHLSTFLRLEHGMGIFSKNSNELISWAMRSEYSNVAILQTKEKYRRKGYAKLIIKDICKKEVEKNQGDILTFIVDGNTPSERLFHGLGFMYEGSNIWLDYDVIQSG